MDNLDRQGSDIHLAIQDLVCRAPKFFQKMPTMARRSGGAFIMIPHMFSSLHLHSIARCGCSSRWTNGGSRGEAHGRMWGAGVAVAPNRGGRYAPCCCLCTRAPLLMPLPQKHYCSLWLQILHGSTDGGRR